MRQTPIYLPQLTWVNKVLIIVLGATLLLDSILVATAGMSLTYLTGLQGDLFFSGHIYKLLTWPLVVSGPFEALFDGLILWFIGSELEMMWGRQRYIRFLVASVVGGGVCFLLASWAGDYGATLSGMGGVASAVCVAFGVLFPHRVMYFLFFPLKAKYLVAILVGLNLYQGVFSPGRALAWGVLGACLGAFLWMRWRRWNWWDEIRERLFYKKKWRHLKLVNDKFDREDDDNNSTYH